jgi:hypothetical protein
LRTQIAEAVRRMIESSSPDPCLDDDTTDALAHAIVGAGESLANWWLEHPEIPRERVVNWYVNMVRAGVSA